MVDSPSSVPGSVPGLFEGQPEVGADPSRSTWFAVFFFDHTQLLEITWTLKRLNRATGRNVQFIQVTESVWLSALASTVFAPLAHATWSQTKM